MGSPEAATRLQLTRSPTPKRTGIGRAEITSRSSANRTAPAPSPVRFRPEYGRECGTSCGIHQIAGFTTTGWLREQSRANPSPGRRASRGPSSDFRRVLSGRVRSGQSPGKFLNSLLLPPLTREGRSKSRDARPAPGSDRPGAGCRARRRGEGGLRENRGTTSWTNSPGRSDPFPAQKAAARNGFATHPAGLFTAGLFCRGTKNEHEPEAGGPLQSSPIGSGGSAAPEPGSNAARVSRDHLGSLLKSPGTGRPRLAPARNN